MTIEMELVVDARGGVWCIYDEGINLREIGTLKITRASHVEADAEGCWWADMGPSGGPVLGAVQEPDGGVAGGEGVVGGGTRKGVLTATATGG